MTEPSFTESVIENAAMAWFEGTGWRNALGPEIALGTLLAKRKNTDEKYFAKRLRSAFLLTLISGELRVSDMGSFNARIL